MTEWKNDTELFNLIKKELYTAVIGDIMDKKGYLRQFLPPHIRPLEPNMFIAGRAMTVLEADIPENKDYDGNNPLLKRPFGLMLDALDDLQQNEVYICAGSSLPYALWGELMSARAIHLGAAGAVVDGFSRDTHGILNLKFPTFSHGKFAQDQSPRGKVVDFRVPIEIAGVPILPGDLVVGDIDGVCIVPKKIEEEVITEALVKARGEKLVYKEIIKGMSARDAFEQFGIL